MRSQRAQRWSDDVQAVAPVRSLQVVYQVLT